jgi:putative peptidoglycan lipid II flippase
MKENKTNLTNDSDQYNLGPSFFGAIRQIGTLTAVSRLLGFGRDVILALTLGAGPLADAFFVAFKLPNLFRRLTAEGAITNAFLPAYAKAEQSGGMAAARLAAEIQLTLLWGVVVLTVLFELAMPLIITVLAPGFTEGGERFSHAVTLARITMPFLPMISMVAFWAALTNANNRFFGGAAAPIILNIMLILGALASSLFSAFGIIPLALALPVAGLLQMILMQRMLMAIDKRPHWGFWPKISVAGKTMWRRFFAAAIGAGGTQLNLLVDTILASTLPVGAISSLYYADRIAQLPLGVIGIALGTALLPRLSRLEAMGADAEVRGVLARGVRIGMFFALPAMVGAVLLAEPIIGGLFGYGAFSLSMITPTAYVLMAYAIGIPAFVLSKIFQPAFYAANDPKTPLKIAMLTVVFNLIASLILMQVLGAAGLALATSLASWLSVVIMVVILWRRQRVDASSYVAFGPIILAATMMGGGLYIIKPILDHHLLGWQLLGWGLFADAFQLFLLMVIGVVIYFIAGFCFGALPGNLHRAVRQK